MRERWRRRRQNFHTKTTEREQALAVPHRTPADRLFRQRVASAPDGAASTWAFTALRC